MKKMPDQVRFVLRLHALERNGEGTDKAKAIQEVVKGLDSSLWKRYVRLKKRKGTGVALLKDGVCSGCNMVYPETHEIQRYEKFVHNCEFCGRLLVVERKEA